MEALVRQISSTIYVPDFLKDFQHPHKNDIVEMTFEILNFYYTSSINPEFLHNRKIKRICKDIDMMSQILCDMAPSEIYLNSWLWIGDTVETWIKMAEQLEEFEVASNLKKVLNSEYV